MSLQLMKERVKISGVNTREEMIKDGADLLKSELGHDSSFSTTMYFCIQKNNKPADDKFANLRIHNRKYSTVYGNQQNFLTTIDNVIKVGDYFHDTKDDTYWLVTESFNVNDIHYEGKMVQCNYLMKWQLSNGNIVEQFTNVVTASKYDTGESSGNTIILTSNNYTILIGYNEAAMELEEKRVFIDKNKINPKKVFKITRNDDILYDYGNNGSLLSFIADKRELNANSDRPDLGICDYIEPTTPPTDPPETDETAVLSASIIGNTELKLGIPRTYTVTFTDKNGVEVTDIEFTWNVVADFTVEQVVKGNTIELYVNDDTVIGESFILQVLISDSVVAEIEITVVDMF